MEIIKTKDDSFTLYSDLYKEHYHSINGAVNESEHIYIRAGLKVFDLDKINIFEMGLGTGLNAYLTALYAQNTHQRIHYTAIEKHPLESNTFLERVPESFRNPIFNSIHSCPWNKISTINKQMSLLKIEGDIQSYKHQSQYHLVYYDAFSPDTQAELWTAKIFSVLYKAMHTDGVLVTYSVKGDVKRALKSVGFRIEKLPGPKGKREILRAIK